MKTAIHSNGRAWTVEPIGASVAVVAATAADRASVRACVAGLLTPDQAIALAYGLMVAATLAQEHVTPGQRNAESMAVLGLLRTCR